MTRELPPAAAPKRTGSTSNLHAIVLAAGESSRFGSPKQLVRLDGELLLHRVLHSASEVAGAAVTVVLGAHAAQLVPILPPVGMLVNREWREGIASSIRAGVRGLPGACDGVLILLADQPMVAGPSLNRLAAAWRRQPRHIVASRYGSVTGVPAIFPRWCFDELCALRGDVGARALLARHADRVIPLVHPEAAIDIDQPEDLLNLGG